MCAIQHAQHAHGQQFIWQAFNITSPPYSTCSDASIRKKNRIHSQTESRLSGIMGGSEGSNGAIAVAIGRPPKPAGCRICTRLHRPWRCKVVLITALACPGVHRTNSCHGNFMELCFWRDDPGYLPGLEPTQSQTNNPTRFQSNSSGAGVVEEGAVEVQIL